MHDEGRPREPSPKAPGEYVKPARAAWQVDTLMAVIDQWGGMDAEYTGTVVLLADTLYDIQIEYKDSFSSSKMQLQWKSASLGGSYVVCCRIPLRHAMRAAGFMPLFSNHLKTAMRRRWFRPIACTTTSPISRTRSPSLSVPDNQRREAAGWWRMFIALLLFHFHGAAGNKFLYMRGALCSTHQRHTQIGCAGQTKKTSRVVVVVVGQGNVHGAFTSFARTTVASSYFQSSCAGASKARRCIRLEAQVAQAYPADRSRTAIIDNRD